MYIQTRKQENELDKILLENEIIPTISKIGYDWKLIFENKFENIEDFELFCISITKDLFVREFQNKEGFYKNIEEHTEDSEEDSEEEDSEEEDSEEEDSEEEDSEEEDSEDSEEEDFDGFDFIFNGINYLFNVIGDKQLKNEKK